MATFPTNDDDILVAGSGETVDGLGGNDYINGYDNFARLYGNIGDDWLVSGLNFESYLSGVFEGGTYQDGGEGDDQLDVKMRFDNTNLSDPSTTSADLSAVMSGGSGEDILTLLMAADNSDLSGRLWGGPDDDRIIASAVNTDVWDTDSRSYDLFASGGGGDDFIQLRSDTGPAHFFGFETALTGRGSAGNDTLIASAFASAAVVPSVTILLEGGSGSDVLRSVAEVRTEYDPIADIRLLGGGGGDRIEARTLAYGDSPEAVNRLEGGSGSDNLNAVMVLLDPSYFSQSGLAENRLYGGSGNDSLRGEVVESLLDGSDRSLLYGGSGADQLRVVGGDGNVLRGGAGADRSWGGDGEDQFQFVAISDSRASARDSIMNFGVEDLIDVSRIDAGGGPGDQAFAYGGTSQTGAGYLWIQESGDDAIVTAETVSGQRLVVRVADAADFGWSEDSFLL